MNHKNLLTVPEAALFMGIHYNTVYAAMLEGRLPFTEIVGRKVITRIDAEAYRERTHSDGEKPKGRPQRSANRKRQVGK